jgi:hypothetical protein
VKSQLHLRDNVSGIDVLSNSVLPVSLSVPLGGPARYPGPYQCQDIHISVLNYNVVDEEALEKAIKQLMDDKKVKVNVDRMSSLVKDSRTDPLEVSAELKHYPSKIYNLSSESLRSHVMNDCYVSGGHLVE